MSDLSSGERRCPPPETWDLIATGLSKGPEALTALEHASTCDRCAGVLRDSIAIFAPEEPAPQPAVAQTYWKWALAAGIVALLGLSGMWLAITRPADTIARELAIAYTAQRPSAWRWPGARRAEVRVLRGPAESLPPEFYSSRERVLREIARKPEDARFAMLLGESLAFEGQFDKAVAQLRRALDLAPDSEDIRLALAGAYFRRGETQQRPIDFQAADELLGQVLQRDPLNSVALFNRALTQHHLGNLVEAVNLFDRLTAIERDPAWKAEAIVLRDQLRAKLSPGGRLSPPEARFEEWLAGLEPAKSASPGTARLARELDTAHRDGWLASLSRLVADAAETDIRLLSELAALRRRQEMGALRPAVLRARDLASFSRHPEIRVWAAFEYAYWQTHSTENAPWCDDVDVALRLASKRSWPWFQAQLLLERSTHLALSADQAGNTRDTLAAIEVATRHALAETRLRGLNFLGSRHIRHGDYRRAMDVIAAGLTDYWTSRRDPRRAYHFLFDAMRVAEATGRPHAAEAAITTAAALLQATDAPLLGAIAEVRSGEWLMKTGQRAEAAARFARARETLRRAPASPVRRTYEMLAALSEAEAAGEVAALETFQDKIRVLPEPFIRLRFARIRAELALRNERRVSVAELESALEFSLHSAAGLARSERIGWMAESERAWRSLVSADLARGDYAAAFERWQAFRSASAADLPEGAIAPGGFVPRLCARTRDGSVTAVVFFRQGDRLGRWTAASGALRFEWLPVDAGEVMHQVRVLARLCADPESGAEAADRNARRLAAALLGGLDASAAVLVEPDTELASTPWSALAAAIHLPAIAVALWQSRGPTAARDLQFGAATTLLVASDSPAPEAAAGIRVLADVSTEVQSVSRHFPGSVVLSGSAVTAERLENELSRASVFHYAGHALAGTDRVELLLAPSPSSPEGRWSPDASRPLPRCRLAVFSACSTARYEETATAGPAHLAQAFLLMGTPAVVGSLWDVDSATTRQLIERFYDNLFAAGEPRAALARAASAVAAMRSKAHPYWWAGFQTYELL